MIGYVVQGQDDETLEVVWAAEDGRLTGRGAVATVSRDDATLYPSLQLALVAVGALLSFGVLDVHLVEVYDDGTEVNLPSYEEAINEVCDIAEALDEASDEPPGDLAVGVRVLASKVASLQEENERLRRLPPNQWRGDAITTPASPDIGVLLSSPNATPRWLVFIHRDGGQLSTTVGVFEDRQSADHFYDDYGARWSGAYLCRVVRPGPHLEHKLTQRRALEEATRVCGKHAALRPAVAHAMMAAAAGEYGDPGEQRFSWRQDPAALAVEIRDALTKEQTAHLVGELCGYQSLRTWALIEAQQAGYKLRHLVADGKDDTAYASRLDATVKLCEKVVAHVDGVVGVHVPVVADLAALGDVTRGWYRD